LKIGPRQPAVFANQKQVWQFRQNAYPEARNPHDRLGAIRDFIAYLFENKERKWDAANPWWN
jgi:hypothetical protein